MQRDGGPGGAGGAGNPTGGSFTGPAEALEIVGNHAYAYSGGIALNNETKLPYRSLQAIIYVWVKYNIPRPSVTTVLLKPWKLSLT